MFTRKFQKDTYIAKERKRKSGNKSHIVITDRVLEALANGFIKAMSGIGEWEEEV